MKADQNVYLLLMKKYNPDKGPGLHNLKKLIILNLKRVIVVYLK